MSDEKKQTKSSWLNRFSLSGYPMVSSHEIVYVPASAWRRWYRTMTSNWSLPVACKRMSYTYWSELHAGHEVQYSFREKGKNLALQHPNSNRKGEIKIDSRHKMRQPEFSLRICTPERTCGRVRGCVAEPPNRILVLIFESCKELSINFRSQ